MPSSLCPYRVPRGLVARVAYVSGVLRSPTYTPLLISTIHRDSVRAVLVERFRVVSRRCPRLTGFPVSLPASPGRNNCPRYRAPPRGEWKHHVRNVPAVCVLHHVAHSSSCDSVNQAGSAGVQSESQRDRILRLVQVRDVEEERAAVVAVNETECRTASQCGDRRMDYTIQAAVGRG